MSKKPMSQEDARMSFGFSMLPCPKWVDDLPTQAELDAQAAIDCNDKKGTNKTPR